VLCHEFLAGNYLIRFLEKDSPRYTLAKEGPAVAGLKVEIIIPFTAEGYCSAACLECCWAKLSHQVVSGYFQEFGSQEMTSRD
jgi:hypothetical protein